MNYYLIGIKGSGMSALASILKDLGNNVSGSDVENVYFTDRKLIEKRISIFSFDEENITKDIDIIILGNAFNNNHQEVLRAKELGIEVVRYFDYISELAKKYQSIGISGTNGKTTTTGLINEILEDDEKIILIGDGTGIAGNEPKYFLFEACEYKNTFLNYSPDLGVFTNIEMDHPDFFENIDHVIETYQKYANQCESIIVNLDDENCRKINHKKKYGFGIDNKKANINLLELKLNPEGFSFKLNIDNSVTRTYILPLYGMHMVYNSLAAITVGLKIGKDIDQIIESLTKFNGVSRRFEIEVLDENKNIYLVDDYAHHPSSIKLTLEALKQKYPGYTISCFFQAHTFTRVATFHDQFARELSIADNVYIVDIFGSIREKKDDVDKSIMINDLLKYNIIAKKNIDFIKEIDEKHIIAVLGAGDIDTFLIPQIKKILGE